MDDGFSNETADVDDEAGEPLHDERQCLPRQVVALDGVVTHGSSDLRLLCGDLSRNFELVVKLIGLCDGQKSTSCVKAWPSRRNCFSRPVTGVRHRPHRCHDETLLLQTIVQVAIRGHIGTGIRCLGPKRNLIKIVYNRINELSFIRFL